MALVTSWAQQSVISFWDAADVYREFDARLYFHRKGSNSLKSSRHSRKIPLFALRLRSSWPRKGRPCRPRNEATAGTLSSFSRLFYGLPTLSFVKHFPVWLLPGSFSMPEHCLFVFVPSHVCQRRLKRFFPRSCNPC